MCKVEKNRKKSNKLRVALKADVIFSAKIIDCIEDIGSEKERKTERKKIRKKDSKEERKNERKK